MFFWGHWSVFKNLMSRQLNLPCKAKTRKSLARKIDKTDEQDKCGNSWSQCGGCTAVGSLRWEWFVVKIGWKSGVKRYVVIIGDNGDVLSRKKLEMPNYIFYVFLQMLLHIWLLFVLVCEAASCCQRLYVAYHKFLIFAKCLLSSAFFVRFFSYVSNTCNTVHCLFVFSIVLIFACSVNSFSCLQFVIVRFACNLTCYRELSFHKGDYLYLLRQVDKNWFLGERHGLVGIFPVSYVQVCVCLWQVTLIQQYHDGNMS